MDGGKVYGFTFDVSLESLDSGVWKAW